jgi:hypothetical protein
MYEKIKKQFTRFIVSLVIISIGICCIIFGTIFLTLSGSSGQMEAVSNLTKGIGISLVIASSLSLITHIIGAYTTHNQKVLGVYGSGAMLLLTIGSFFIVHSDASSLVILEVMQYSHFFYIGFGSLFLIDTLLNLRFNVIKHKTENAIFFVIIEGFIAISFLVLGLITTILSNTDNIDVRLNSHAISSISFGVLVILYGLFVLLSVFKKLPKFEEVMLTTTPDYSKTEEAEELEDDDEVEEIEED